MKERDEHWQAEWKKLSADPNYQHNVAKADIILMNAEEYSDL